MRIEKHAAMVFFLFLVVSHGNASPNQEVKQKPENSPWEEVIHEQEALQPVRMAAFLNDSFGITGGMGGAGRTHYTQNGGKTWIKSEDSGGCIYGVDIVDKNVVWVCGRMAGVSFTTPGGIRMSRDAAQTWGPTTNFNTIGSRSLIHFLDSLKGWAYNKVSLIRTQDGGINWEKIALPASAENVAAITYIKPGVVYILDTKFTMYSSEDEGKTWKSLPLKLNGIGKESELPILNDLATADICFTDENNGIVALNLQSKKNSNLLIYRTVDGGRAWKEESLPVSIVFGIPWLSHDGKYLTVSVISAGTKISVFRFKNAL